MKRTQHDGLTNDSLAWQRAENFRLDGETPGDCLGLSFYAYGAMVYFRHGCGQLEFHGYAGGGYSAVCTMSCDTDINIFQVRQKGDTNAIQMIYGKGEDAVPYVTTEFQGTPLALKPKGDLILAPAGNVMVGKETLEAYIRRICTTS